MPFKKPLEIERNSTNTNIDSVDAVNISARITVLVSDGEAGQDYSGNG